MKLNSYVRKGSFFKAVVEDGSDIIFIVDFEGLIRYHNASVKENLGYRSGFLLGKNFFDFIHPDQREEIILKFREGQKRAFVEKVEFRFRCRDKSHRFLEFNAINLRFKENLDGFILDCRDISERKQNEAELVRLQKAKEQFLANISHEIRTPINGIAGMANLLNQNPTTEERDSYLQAIRHSAENLKVIINDILDLAAIESGKLRLEAIAFNLNDLLPSVINTFAYQAKEKRISLKYEIESGLNRFLLGDPVRLNQILINLISNAVKFTHHGGITITCRLEKETKTMCRVAISVVDTGVGIPQQKLTTIFESFSQADASVTRRYGGTGLGLTIVKQLVELQKGIISVESNENEGSNFTFTIPYPIARVKDFGKSESNTKPKGVNIETKNIRILLVEDNDINRLYAKSILKTWNCIVDTAENGLIAIEKVKNNDYDVILMDVQMPVMDGYESTKAIRAMEGRESLPIIALTANATQNHMEQSMAAGMNEYLSKPFTPEELYHKLFHEMSIKPADPKKVRKSGSTHNYNLDYLRTVSDNNIEFIREMIGTFINSIPTVLNDMKKAADQSDWNTVSRLAHQVKPSFTLMGLDFLKKDLAFLEDNGKNNTRIDEMPAAVFRFVEKCEDVMEDIAREPLIQ